MTPVATGTDLTTDDGAGRVRRLPLVGVVLAGALLLSACGGSPEVEAQAGSEEPGTSATAGESGDDSSGPDTAATRFPRKTTGTSEVSGEPTPAPSEGPARHLERPQAPGEVAEKTEAGTEAAVQHWWEVLAYSRMTGATEPLSVISGDGCGTCEARIENVTRVLDGDAWYANVSYDVQAEGVDLDRDGSANGPAFITAPSCDACDTAGEHRTLDEMNDDLWHAELTFAGGRWRIAEMAVFSDSSAGGTD
ncbi:hypothetical protein GCM10027060_20120 [Nesterenkonia halophila]|uniref:DUF6318 family protein n=1 Tax=Nesterenkonia halophila TaxID=302044 RepID=UPI001291BA48|nr:DUF6318 family protein [Nesterenkonia halophila]